MRQKLYRMLFPGGLNKGLTLSYDDGVNQDRRLVALFNKYGVKGTFNLNSGTLSRKEIMRFPGMAETDITRIDPEEIPTLYEGHEVAGHGLWHSSLPDIGTPGAMQEIIDDRMNLEKYAGRPVRSFAYPFGTFNEDVKNILRLAGYRSARTIVSTGAFGIPSDFLQWDATAHHNDPKLMELAEEFCVGRTMSFGPKLFYLWGHAYEFDGNNNWDVMEKFLAYVTQYREQIWFATNGEIVDYVEAYKQLRWSADALTVQNPTATDLWMGAGFGNVLQIPAGATVQIPPPAER